MTASLHFAQSNSVGLPRYEILRSGIFNIPLPYGMRLKVSHEGCHIFEQLRPQQHRSAVDETRDSWGWSLSILFSQLWGSGAKSSPLMVLLLLRKVVRFRYCLCTWLPCRIKNTVASTSNKMGCLWTPLLLNQKKEFLVEDMWKLPLYVACQYEYFTFLSWANCRKKISTANLVSTPRQRLVRLIPLLALK